jgi:hypothetical protein
MNYIVGVGLVLLIQLAISYFVIIAGTGNGSFVGLGAMLFAIFGIPATALTNFLIIQQHNREPKPSNGKQIITISCILPALQIGLLFAQLTFNL